MTEELKLNIAIAETAPVVLSGFSNCIRKIRDFRCNISEFTTKQNLTDFLRGSEVDLLIINPTFGGVLNPSELRNLSRNPDIKLFTIEMGKLPNQVLSLYDDHLHVTDDINEITRKINKVCNISEKKTDEKETLSAREKEIVSFVVRGFTNQEIADKLFLSIHTVITHRRNISKKLEIHSATGLTIYAIVNKIVDLSEIKDTL